MTAPPLNLKTAPGHEVLAAAGKKILRPGGRGATETLFTWVDFQPGDTVLELAASFGYSAIALAQRYGVKVVGIEKNSESVVRARANVAAAGLGDRVDIREGDIFHLERVPEQFDYVLGEAILSMQSAPAKAKILQGVGDRLKPGGQFLSHEMLAQGARIDDIYRELATTIRVNTAPLSEAGWQAASEAAGLTVQQHQTGPIALLNPLRIIQEEGLATLLSLGWNVLVHPPMRQRILAMRRVFTEYGDDLGYIILRAAKLNHSPQGQCSFLKVTMTTTILSLQPTFTHLQEHIEYPKAGTLSKVLLQDQVCQYTLFCLAADTEISEHTSTRNAVVQCLEGQGVLTLEGKDIALEPGVFIVMPANAPHALKAIANLAFLLTLSKP